MSQVCSNVSVRKLVGLVCKTRKPNQIKNHRKLHRRITLTSLPRTILGLTMAVVMTGGIAIGAQLGGRKVGRNRISIPQAHSP